MSIYNEIRNEREHQDELWGGPAHDDKHSAQEWIGLLCKHLGKALVGSLSTGLSRIQLIRVAALAIAAIQWIDRIHTRVGPQRKDG